MAKKIKVRVHNPNNIEQTAEAVLKLCIESSIVKFERIVSEYSERKRKINIE